MRAGNRQTEIINIVKQNSPISGEKIAQNLGLSRAFKERLVYTNMTGLLDAKPRWAISRQGKMQPLYIKLYSKK